MSGATDMFDLCDRVCVVTGGGRGIGKRIAHDLAARGATVVVAGRSIDTLSVTSREIVEQGGRAAAIGADMSIESDVIHLAGQVAERFGPAHVLVNNAGINPIYKAPEMTSMAEWNEILAVNLSGVFVACREFGRQMLEAGRGSIVNMSSIAGSVGLARTAAYCASKGGVELLTRSLAVDWATKGVRVNAVAPGFVETDLTSGMIEHSTLSERLLKRTPMRRFAQAEEITGAVIYLASDASRYVTGQTIGVDGGWTAA